MQNKLLWSSAIWLLAACSVGPDYKRPQFFPSSDIASSLQLSGREQKISTDWYTQFDDPFLNTLVARGLTYSPQTAVAVSRLRQARQSLRINAVSYLPTLNADGGYNYVKDSINYGVPISTDYYQLGLDAAWELDIWGGGRRLTESSLALVKAAAADLDNVRLSLTAEIASDYFSLRENQEQLRIAKENLRLQRSIYDLVSEKHKAGLTDDISLNQSAYIVRTTELQIPQLESQIEAYENALAILVGRLPGQLKTMLDNPEHNPIAKRFAYDLDRLYDLPVTVLRNRPDVRAAEYQLISDNAQIGRALSELFPKVSLSSFVGYQSKKLSNLVSSDSDTYSFAPTVTLPLFHWGALVNNVKLQKYAAQEQLEQYRQSLLTAAQEIRNSVVSLQNEYVTNRAAAAAEKAQTEVADLTLLKYKQGLLDFSEVLTSQQNLLSAQKQRISSNGAIYQDIIAFYKAAGGGYSPVEPKKTKPRPSKDVCKG